jgi:hypothetical protein
MTDSVRKTITLVTFHACALLLTLNTDSNIYAMPRNIAGNHFPKLFSIPSLQCLECQKVKPFEEKFLVLGTSESQMGLNQACMMDVPTLVLVYCAKIILVKCVV